MTAKTRLAFAALTLSGIALLAAPTPAADDAPPEKLLKLFVEELVPITPGKGVFAESLQMGTNESAAPATERPTFEITLREPFAIAKFEVTQELYEAVMGKNPSKWKGPRNSVEMVSWDEANEFCK